MSTAVKNKVILHIITLLFIKGFLSLDEYFQMRDLIITI